MAIIYAMSDIHGYYDLFIEALLKIDLSDKDNRLVLLGDFIDNGPQSFQVLSKIIDLEEKFPRQVISLFGNHEEWLYSWLILEDPTAFVFGETLKSFFSKEELNNILSSNTHDIEITLRNEIKRNIKFAPFIDWFKTRYEDNRFYESDDGQIYVHAGIDEEAGEFWKFTSETMFTNKFPLSTGKFLKDIICGHMASHKVARNKKYLGKVYFDQFSHYFIDGDVEQSKIIPVLRYDTITKSYEYER